jgi:hypothetical protein
MVVDTYVLQPPIVTSCETASTLLVLLKGTIIRVCWWVVRFELWVCPCANKWLYFWDRDLLEGISRWFPLKTEIQKWIEEQEKDFVEPQNKNPSIGT